ncbi:hypothetical protein [Pseudoponticoccus marisrubri]|uniref:Uncharacterized protein n=1 Tax=Pseudoponticoccus marisrubri TaxID=1685382 RepID=A0A0W7WNY5_9RHOB|nr:hypothetical protein [Pseudoponticoccus marisrubri]KUF12266.1 hypothetical protein AVJ23_00585 [Pseudoponticoccus marisrubri]
MPKLIRLYILQVATGFGLSAVFVGALMWFNVANLWHLVSGSEAGLIALLMLWIFNGIVFAGVQFGISIMRMGADEGGDGGTRQPEPVRAEATIPVEATERPGPLRFLGRR